MYNKHIKLTKNIYLLYSYFTTSLVNTLTVYNNYILWKLQHLLYQLYRYSFIR